MLALAFFLLLSSQVFPLHVGIARSDLNVPEIKASAQGRNSISGHVFSASRHPIPQMYVVLQDDFYREVTRTRTDDSGSYSFNNLTQGNYLVEVQTSGTNFVGQTARVTIQNFTRNVPGVGVTNSGSEFVQQDFILRTADAKGFTARMGPPQAVFVQEVPDAARKLYAEAVEKIDSNQMNAGLERLKKAIEIFPRYYAALDRLGTEYVKGQQYDPAIPVLTRSVEVNSRGYSSWYALGLAQYNLRQQTAAVESLRRCVTLNPASVNSQLWLGTALRQTSKLDEAETHLKKANELASLKVPEAHWQLALLYNQLKRYGEAADELEQFLKVQPDSRDAESIKKLIKKLRDEERDKMKP